jgi:hypothetical protein
MWTSIVELIIRKALATELAAKLEVLMLVDLREVSVGERVDSFDLRRREFEYGS